MSMSTWQTIEADVVQALQGLTWNESPLLATVVGRAATDRKGTVAAMLRERLPAAYVVVSGRGSSERATGRPGKPVLTVLLGARSYRSETETRTGGVDSAGLFELVERCTLALHGRNIADTHRLALVEEKALAGESGAALWEQSYEARRIAETGAPTFGGVILAGEGSRMRVEVGELRAAVSSFSFPGIDGVFERRLGLRERAIWWRGELRAADDAELNAIETAIEDELREGTTKTMVDSWGRQHEACALKSFRRAGPRRRDELTGEVVQDGEIEFTQLR